MDGRHACVASLVLGVRVLRTTAVIPLPPEERIQISPGSFFLSSLSLWIDTHTQLILPFLVVPSQRATMRAALKFSPEVLIEAPRRGPAVPNTDGTRALFSTSTHTIGCSTLKEVKVLDLSTKGSQLLVANSKGHDFTWLNAGSVVFLERGDKGVTQLKITETQWAEQGGVLEQDSYVVAEFPGPIGLLKVKRLRDGSVALAVVGRVDADGNLFNGETAPKLSSVRVYDNFNVRFVSHYSAVVRPSWASCASWHGF